MASALISLVFASACVPLASLTTTAFPESLSTQPVFLPTVDLSATPLPTRGPFEAGTLVPYTVQDGDTLSALANRFNTTVDAILLANPGRITERTTQPPGLQLLIPASYAPFTGTPYKIIPDSHFVFGPAQAGQDTQRDILRIGGYMARYREFAEEQTRTSWEIVDRVALEYSVNPRLLLALLEFQTGALANPDPQAELRLYPLGLSDTLRKGLFHQLSWAAEQMNAGYYGWRSGGLLEIELADGRLSRVDPWQNAGTVAVQFLLAQFLAGEDWERAVGPEGFGAIYRRFFGNPWKEQVVVIPGGLEQPVWPLPFAEGKTWTFSGGPHPFWGESQPWAALDFAPPALGGGCRGSTEWATAVGPGLIARSEEATVVLDLDGDGDERTGWVVLYFHVATEDRIRVGETVREGDPIGHPSCEGGRATGDHIHLARKFNGEWIPADGNLPFTLSGWMAQRGDWAYRGLMTRGEQVVVACTCSAPENHISR